MHCVNLSRNSDWRHASRRWFLAVVGGGLMLAIVWAAPVSAGPQSHSTALNASTPTGVAPTGIAPTGINGERAMDYARKVVGFGPRVSGSPAILSLRNYIGGELRKNGISVEERPFVAKTPVGDVPMVNVIAKIPGNSGRRILLSGHYDTKRIPGVRFVGANDAGSSTALLLELATVLSGRKAAAGRRDEIWIVFFDGEEAVESWTDTDSLYGSRRLAEELEREGTLDSIRALINVDMIGDRDLNLVLEYNSTPALRDLALEVAAAQGHRSLFDRQMSAIEDDHIPFAKRGVPVLDLIDFSYGPANAWWHSEDDTIDKLAPNSFHIVGNLVLGIVDRLDR